MKPECVAAVAKAAGRAISRAEANGLEARLRENLRTLARADREAFLAMPVADRLREAAKLTAKELKTEAAETKRRLLLKIAKHDAIDAYVADAKARGLTGMDALERTLLTKGDLKSKFTSVESRTSAIHADSMRQLWDTLEATEPRVFGMMRNPEAVRLLVKELAGEDSGSPIAKKGAEAFKLVSDQLRERFNAAGGKIGKLDNYRTPQAWDQMKAAEISSKDFARFMLPLMDRSRYVNLSGRLMDDAEMSSFLTEAHKTIATGGLNKMEPGAASGSRMAMVANRGSEARQLHFKDADSYLAAQGRIGASTIEQGIASHVRSLSRDIALTETYGPNPEHTLGFFMDREAKAAAEADPKTTGKVKAWLANMDRMYAYLAGLRDPASNPRLAKIAQGARNYLMATKLLSSPITAITDSGFLHVTGRFNGIPSLQMFRNELAAYNPLERGEKRALQSAGLGIESWTSELNRWGDENLGRGWTANLAQQSLRLAGLDALDSTRRRAIGSAILNSIGNLTREHNTMAELKPWDRQLMESKGINERDWQVFRMAETDDIGHGNSNFLHPDSIMRIPDDSIAAIRTAEGEKLGDVFTKDPSQTPAQVRNEAVTKLLARALDEGAMAVPAPGAAEHMLSTGTRPGGDLGGELWRAFTMFKSFSFATFSKHFMQRGMGQGSVGGRISYIAQVVAATTIMGAVASSIGNVLNGKDPQRYWDAPSGELVRNWVSAFLKGGSLGIYGDFLFSGVDKNGMNDLFGALAGPELSLVQQALNVSDGPLQKFAIGKDVNGDTEAANLIKMGKGLTPLTGLWYAKAALDHLVWNEITDYFAPGYLGRMQARAERDFNERFFWAPRQDIQQARAPNIARAVGGTQ